MTVKLKFPSSIEIITAIMIMTILYIVRYVIWSTLFQSQLQEQLSSGNDPTKENDLLPFLPISCKSLGDSQKVTPKCLITKLYS